MSDYSHRQAGTIMLAFMVPALLVTAVVMARSPENAAARLFVFGVVLTVTAISILMFGWLTVQVTRDRLSLRFGVGLVRRRFSISEMRSARPVRNPWYYGWGIRYTPHGWLFNVSGLDAVEIELRSGRRYRIGTDEAPELMAAIQRAMAEHASRQRPR